jgi:hypothetical protein
MRLLRVGDPGDERPAVEDGDHVFDISPMTDDIDGAFLARDGVLRVRDALRRGHPPARTSAPSVRRSCPPRCRPARVGSERRYGVRIGIAETFGGTHARLATARRRESRP